MSVVTVKTNKQTRRGKSVILAGVEVKFDDLLLADVPERHVEKLVNAGLEIVGEKDLAKYAKLRKDFEDSKTEEAASQVDFYDENAKLKLKVSELEIENKALTEKALALEEELDLLKSESDGVSLESLTVEELKETCKYQNYPKKEWANLEEKALKKYLAEKMK